MNKKREGTKQDYFINKMKLAPELEKVQGLMPVSYTHLTLPTSDLV